MSFSRTNPSPRYLELLEYYKHLHEHGDALKDIPAEDMFAGISLVHYLPIIKDLIDKTAAVSLLDYGAGKAQKYHQPVTIEGVTYSSYPEYFGIEDITLYDPAYTPLSTLPDKKYDGVICTDVLEHCPEQDIPWILEELYRYASKFIVASIACYPASKTLPNGENAHCTIKDPSWWLNHINQLSEKYPNLLINFLFCSKTDDTGTVSVLPAKNYQ